jgi:small conductance mechanosensitive channel
MTMTFDEIIAKLQIFVLEYGGRLLGVVIAFLVGRKAITKIIDILTTQMNIRKMDEDLKPFLLSITSAILNLILILLCTNIIGIETTSFVAIFSAAGLAVGFALQGSLSNFASGVLLLVFKPFKFGDIINIQGTTGKVQAIRVFDTVIITPDNKTIIIPNGKIFSGNIINYTAQGTIRVDMFFAASNQHPADTIRRSIQKAIDICPFAIQDKTHDIMIGKLNDKAIQFDISVWTDSHTYWETYYFLNEAIYRQFIEDGIQSQAIIK